MAWTYDDDEASAKDRVRGIIGDVTSTDPWLSDGKINALLAANSDSVLLSARAAVKAVLAKFSRADVDARFGPSSVSASKRQENLRDILADINEQISLSALPFAGGISKSDKETYEDDTDRVEPAFTRTLFESSDSLSLGEDD